MSTGKFSLGNCLKKVHYKCHKNPHHLWMYSLYKAKHTSKEESNQDTGQMGVLWYYLFVEKLSVLLRKFDSHQYSQCSLYRWGYIESCV